MKRYVYKAEIVKQNKPCSECRNLYFRSHWETDTQWKRRRTCGGDCRRARGRRTQRAKAQKLKAAP